MGEITIALGKHSPTLTVHETYVSTTLEFCSISLSLSSPLVSAMNMARSAVGWALVSFAKGPGFEPRSGQKFMTKVRDLTGHRGFSPGTPAASLPLNNTGCSQFNFTNTKIYFPFSFRIAISLPLHQVYVLYTVVFVVCL